MNADTLPPPAARPAVLWRDPPRRRGLARVARPLARLWRRCRNHALSRFIHALGVIGAPGMRSVGALQARALRAMGARCASTEIWIGPDVRFEHPEHLVLGRRVTIAGDARITSHAEVVLGDDFLAAPGLFINTGGHDLATLAPHSAPVVVGPGVWCGVRVTICPGVAIGADAVVGAGSVVVRDLPAAHVCVGVPCKPVRDIAGLRRERDARWSNFRPE